MIRVRRMLKNAIFLCSLVLFVQCDIADELETYIQTLVDESAGNFVSVDEVIERANFGDLIEVKRKGYHHWSIYTDDEIVLQLNNPDFDQLAIYNVFDNFTGYIELKNIRTLVAGDLCRVNNKVREAIRNNMTKLSAKQIKKMIAAELRQNVTYYNVVSYNCEHYATKIKFGVIRSAQINAAYELATSGNMFQNIVMRMFKSAKDYFTKLKLKQNAERESCEASTTANNLNNTTPNNATI